MKHRIKLGPPPTTAGQKQVVIHEYEDGLQLVVPDEEAGDPLTSEAASAYGLKRINRRHYTRMRLPDIELVSAAVHNAWMDSKRAQGVTSRKSESGEELMVPYDQLSEAAKDLDRGSVQAVYAAIRACEAAEGEE